MVLVGDSLGMVVQGHNDTLQVTLDHMVYHGQCVARGLKTAHLTVDLPFMSYQVNSDEALRNAGRMVKEAGAEAVKLEGGRAVAPTVRRIVDAGIPVMGHLGLTPQSIHKFGTYQVRATEAEEAEELRRDAKLLEENKDRVRIERDPRIAATGADLLVTDVWASMGQEDEADTRLAGLAPYQLNRALLDLAAPDALYMHCLPAHRGEEITTDLMDDPESVIWDEAENRLHAQKALIELLLA